MTIEDQPGFDPRLAERATVSLALVDTGTVVLAGCLRNASAVAAAAHHPRPGPPLPPSSTPPPTCRPSSPAPSLS